MTTLKTTLKKTAHIHLFLALAVFLSSCGHLGSEAYFRSPYVAIESLKPGSILHVETGILLTETEFVDNIASSRVVYVGESHKNLNDHAVQLKVIKALHEKYPGKIAVGMEMFQKPSQKVLDDWMAGKITEKELFRQWIKDWGINFELYREIFVYLKEKKIPVIALNVDRRHVLALSQGSHGKKAPAEAAPDKDIGALPELDETDPYHREMVKAVYGDPSHGNHGFDKFYRIQLLWEETMAESIANYLGAKGNEKKKMVVLAGGGHINFGYGVPRRAFRRLKAPYSTVMPVSVNVVTDKEEAAKIGAELMDVEMPGAPLHLADFVWANEFKTIMEDPPKLGVHVLGEKERLTVTAVIPGSAAEAAQMIAGDEIKKVNDVTTFEIADIAYALNRKKHGETVKVVVKRGEHELTLDVTLKPPPQHEGHK